MLRSSQQLQSEIKLRQLIADRQADQGPTDDPWDQVEARVNARGLAEAEAAIAEISLPVASVDPVGDARRVVEEGVALLADFDAASDLRQQNWAWINIRSWLLTLPPTPAPEEKR